MSNDEWRALAQVMTVNGVYNAAMLPDTRGKWFWSSLVHSDYPYDAFYFNGFDGYVVYYHRDYHRSVRCVR